MPLKAWTRCGEEFLAARPSLRLAELDEVPVRVAEEAPDLRPVVDWRGQEDRPATRQCRGGVPAVRDTAGHRVADSVAFWGAKVSAGLSGVGSPPVTRRSQVPATDMTTLVPPYSGRTLAPSTSR